MMKKRLEKKILGAFFLPFFLVFFAAAGVLNPDPPNVPVKLIFIHHSCGENWLADWDGGLGLALRDNNTFVSDTNYGWGPDNIGDLTDIGHWWTWFRGTKSSTYLNALYQKSSRSGDFYSRMPSDPGGENEIIMFKSCYPNSYLDGNPHDSPTTGNNPLRGQDCWSGFHTVGNAKGIYNDILEYFATRTDKLFVVVTAPPQAASETDVSHAANVRAFNNWLVNDWLAGYAYHNVVVFDFYNVLTSNGGDSYTNDAGWDTGNHHRYWSGGIQHQKTVDCNTAAYPCGEYDSHPTAAGNVKATEEFVQFLNVYYHCWKGTGDCPGGNGENQPPVVDGFTAEPRSGEAPLAVIFSCAAHDPDGSIAEYRWDFNGDGSPDVTTNTGETTHTYTAEGTYAASCYVVDNGGALAGAGPMTIFVGKKQKKGRIRR
ncbi:MAG: PKD domain-containing protein [Candidatus Aminicenantes bacterium]|nr:PKD domain-containing protein [Candidatus Aminicenantes bacterium]